MQWVDRILPVLPPAWDETAAILTRCLHHPGMGLSSQMPTHRIEARGPGSGSIQSRHQPGMGLSWNRSDRANSPGWHRLWKLAIARSQIL